MFETQLMIEGFTQLPLWYTIMMAALLGAVMASFVNVVAYRLHTNVSINGRSHCLSCGHRLRWYELVPVLSYTVLRGRCRCCSARIPVRDLGIEILGAVLYVQVFLLGGPWWTVLLSWMVVSLLLAIALYDIEHFIIPDELVLMLAGVGSVAFILNTWPISVSALIALVTSVAMAAGLYGALWWYSGGRWLGFGDVKLAAALGLLLTVESSFSMVILSFWIGAFVGVTMIGLSFVRRQLPGTSTRQHQLHMKSEIPFAPFIVLAFLLVYMYDIHVLSLFTPWI